MIRKYVLPLIALAGLVFALISVKRGSVAAPVAEPVAQPSRAPFESYVAGAGIIEASTENIAIGTPVGNIVTDVFVKVGDRVKAGAPLFQLRDSITAAELEVRKAAVAAAKSKLERLKSLPRPEDAPPAEARVREAEAMLADQKEQLELWNSVQDKRAVSAEDMIKKRFAVQTAEARLNAAKAELDLLKAGAWKHDIAVAEVEVASAEAARAQVEAEIERRTIKAPVDGEVLQVKVRPGEYAMTGVLATPLMLLGGTEELYVRVDIDENDAWRVNGKAPAVAFVRGNPMLKTNLTFVRIEPYIVPKKSLTGESTERVDTRVLQVLYRFERDALPVYVGQQMDVFIEAPPLVIVARPTTAKVAQK